MVSRADPEPTIFGKFSSPGDLIFLSGAEPLRHAPFEDSPKASVPSPLVATRSRSGEDDGGARRASSDYDKLLFCLRRHGTQGIFSSLIEDEDYGFAKIC